jgi:hypothetical protein
VSPPAVGCYDDGWELRSAIARVVEAVADERPVGPLVGSMVPAGHDRARNGEALLDSVIRWPLDERVREQILAETRGNPLALGSCRVGSRRRNWWAASEPGLESSRSMTLGRVAAAAGQRKAAAWPYGFAARACAAALRRARSAITVTQSGERSAALEEYAPTLPAVPR